MAPHSALHCLLREEVQHASSKPGSLSGISSAKCNDKRLDYESAAGKGGRRLQSFCNLPGFWPRAGHWARFQKAHDKNPALSTLKLTAYRAPPPNMVTSSYLGGLGAQRGARTALELASSDRGCAWK